MSGALSLLNRGIGVARGAVQSATALANLFNGGIGGSGFGATLTLGGFAFEGIELPEKISCGGTQKHALHEFPGGGRRVDVMGPQEGNLTWSGIFLSADASEREQQVSAMRRAGNVVPLAFGPVVVPVLVIDFNIDWRDAGHYIQYNIVCLPLPPPAAAGRDADDEDEDLTGMDDASPIDGIAGALTDAANSVGEVVSDVADAAGQALGIAQGAFAAVSSVITPLTNALGIRVPFLSQAGAMINMARGAVGGLASAGAGLKAVNLVGQFQSNQLATVDDRIDGRTGDGAANANTLTAVSDDARDAAVGTRSQAAVGSAAVAQFSVSAQGVLIPLRPMPAGAVPVAPMAAVPFNTEQLRPTFNSGQPVRDPLALRSQSQNLIRLEIENLRRGGMSEEAINYAVVNAGRPDLYTP